MELLERDTQLAQLEAALSDVSRGHGAVVLVSGEAGAGKTSMTRLFVTRHSTHVRVFWGACDDLHTPRPFGPFRDIASQGGDAAAIAGAHGAPEVLDELLSVLEARSLPTILVVEDAHWADDATLDAIRFLGRRISRLHAMLIVTYRDDEVPTDHALRVAVGGMPVGDVRRIQLPPLSPDAVARLAGDRDARELYALTGGNPFFVRELIATPSAEIPATVQDAVMARVTRLGQAGRACAEYCAVVPSRAQRWLVAEAGLEDGLDEAQRAGVLRTVEGWVAFSHELARRAVEIGLSGKRRKQLNQQVLHVLVAHNVDSARIVHHAVEADDDDVILKFAPIAARRAAELDSHREAVEHFAQALDRYRGQPDADLAMMLYKYAYELYLIGRHHAAADALRKAVDILVSGKHRLQLGESLTLLSDVYWFLGRGRDADESARRAIDALSEAPRSSCLARALSQRAKLAGEDGRFDEAITWGEKAVDLARELGETTVLVNALNAVGAARWRVPPYDNSSLVEGLELSKAEGLTQPAGRAYANLGHGYRHIMQYNQAATYFDAGLTFCEDHDLLTGRNFILAYRAWSNLEQGNWHEAERDVRIPAASEDVSRITALLVLGLIYVRRGDGDAEQTLREAKEQAERTGEPQNIVPILLASAELAWLNSDMAKASTDAACAFEIALRTSDRRWISESAYWLHRLGGHVCPTTEILEPYRLMIEESWHAAARAWASIGRPYERADALASAPETESWMEALKILDQLGAVPRAALLREQMAAAGIRSVPRGPRRTTRTSPAGLTERQTEVLFLLAEGLTYQEIAERMHLSVKTVDHHVSAVRFKLGVSTRADAVAVAERVGIISARNANSRNHR